MAARKRTAGSRKAEAEGPSGDAPGHLVVGVGASEVSFRSLERLFAHMPADTGAAFVVAVQQRAGIDQQAVIETLGRQSNLPAALAVEGEALLPDHIYLVPQGFVVTVTDGHLHVRRSEEPPGLRGTVDSLLVSIAEKCRDRSIAVALAGLGSDGMLGVREVKTCGGFALVEASDGAEEEPGHTSAEGIADVVAPVETLAERIAGHIRHLMADGVEEPASKAVTEQLTRIAAILRNRTGHDFHGYKQNTFLRRIQRRMKVTQVDKIEDYADQLRRDGEEAQHLFQDLLISVTEFFRDSKEFALIEREVIPKLFEGKGAADQVRIWVLGCATGEEAYSLAILLREYAAHRDITPHMQIFATDIDARALGLARSGRYPASIAQHVSAERLARWFTKEGDTYCVSKELREMCIFSGHNLIRDAPFSRIDLISCRNLLIYLDSELQNRLIPLFHFALRPDGYLFLGPSENVTRHGKLFAPIDRGHRVFRRLDAVVRGLPDFPLSVNRGRGTSTEGRPLLRTKSADDNLARRAERVAERYAPAYVVIDEHYEILHFSGRTGRYLEPTTGAASLNLMNLLHRDLRPEVRAALHRVLDQREPLRLERLQMEVDGETQAVAVAIEPIPGDPQNPPTLMVVFQDVKVAADPARDGAADDPARLRDEHVQRVEAELRVTRERLQAAVEELESTNEELKSSNEEYQSINEELQSANEELETSKEELQSVNEELQTVNGELAHRVSELATANSDLKNLLESTQIATVFLDNQLLIKNYTPAIADVFHLVETDLGRPIGHIKARLAYPELQEDARQVARTLGVIEREVSDPQKGTRYIVRVLPYRSTDNFIAGVVMTFLDVTATARAETALRESEERFRRMTQAAPVFLMTAGADLGWDYVNAKFCDYTGLNEGTALGNGWLAAVHPDDVERNQKRWREAARTGSAFEDEYRLRNKDGVYRWFLARAEPAPGPDGKTVRWFGSCADVNDLRGAQTRQRLLLAELQHRVKNILALVRAVAARTARNSEDIDDFMSHFEGRLSALARSQAVLAHRNGGGVDLDELVRDEMVAHGHHEGKALKIDGPLLRLNGRVAETLGLAIHELTTNAVKYGALSAPKGKLEVSWRIYDSTSGRRLSFEWRESGVPVIDPSPARMGFGRELLEQALPYELGASSVLEFARGGLRCVVELSLAEHLVTEDEEGSPPPPRPRMEG